MWAYTEREGGEWIEFIPAFSEATFKRLAGEWTVCDEERKWLSRVLVEDNTGKVLAAAAVRLPSGEIYDPIVVAFGEDGWDHVPVCAGTQQEK